jgi:dipeptidyl aminopeptidase/acylaminoacyl peptidase
VILCHGGPETRAGSPFNREALFLADRGLVVLEPNFRGSKGFGLGFLKAGHGQWGRAMNEDLQDGAAWLADLGLADPRRIGIMGSSYGGYAALAGVALTPDTYACAVAQAGPADLLTFLASPLCRVNAPYWKLLVGDPEGDAEGLKAVSPFHQAHRIKVPVLLAHGARDPRVPAAESERMAAALRARNHPVRQLVWPEEGHGFSQEENELEFYRAVETFFARHLGSQADPVR